MNRDQIIETGARALADAWDPAAFRLVLPAEFAEAAYDAMVPLIRAQVAEEIADLCDQWAAHPDNSGDQTQTYQHAAAFARQIGGEQR